MRDQPQPIDDPYRVLGLEPGATMVEVKRAYRRLAKAFHPDSAGEAALPRFLAIHEAYERLATGRSRAGVGPRAARPSPAAPTPSAEPWRADPERARAARERARAGRTSTGTRPGAGAAGGRARTGTSGSTGAASGAKAAGGSGPREGRRRNVRKATMGSTSYDEAREATDATWSGASWYGPTSGEYWIVNPREYADPRKHGPGYQQRARRPTAAGAAGSAEAVDAAEPGVAPGAEAPEAERASATAGTDAWAPDAGGEARHDPSRDARRWSASARPEWASTGEGATAADQGWQRTGAREPGDDRPSNALGSVGAVGRDLLDAPSDDPIRRLGLALVAWPPLGLAAAAAIGDVTGCTSYSAACSGSDTILPWLAQAAILGLLLLLPPLARLFVGGTIAVLLALVPVTAFLVVVGAGGAPQAAFALGALLAAAWIGGVAFAARGQPRPAA